ncbi:MAG: hypothetical protein GY716_19375, partial [bacterium]|nr:hypothetical protein [bacterium]
IFQLLESNILVHGPRCNALQAKAQTTTSCGLLTRERLPEFDVSAPRHEVRIRITCEMGEELARPVVHARGLGGDGYELEERFTFVWPDGDAYVEVSLDGTVIHARDKFKRTESGFRRCSCFRYLEVLEMPTDD